MTELTLARVGLRDGLRCVHCGTEFGLSLQHRANRGMGGRLSADLPSNGIILCWALNEALERDAGLAEHARAMGWKLSRYAVTADVPFWEHPTQRWVTLDDHWGRDPAREIG